MILIDTSGWLAALGHSDEPDHQGARAAYMMDNGPAVLSPFILAELDYLLLRRAGLSVELGMLREVAQGVLTLAEFSPRDVDQAAELAERYADLKVGLADASIVVLAARYDTTRVLTFDQRHFRAMTPLQGGAFTVLPADAVAG